MRQLDQQTRQRILDALGRLVATPSHGDVRKLQGATNVWRLRVGDWRVHFRRVPDTQTVVVLRVEPRGRAYRR